MTASHRLARPEDLPAVLALYAELNPSDPPPEPAAAALTWQAILATETVGVHLVEWQGAVVATCTLIVTPNLTRGLRPFAMIENVVSAGAVRGRGFGKLVVGAAVDHAWAQGCYKVMLMTGRSDPGVIAFYEACGFRRDKTAFQIRR